MFVKLNGKKIKFVPGQTILELAKKHKISIPNLCYHPDLKVQANCRICVVEVKGWKDLATACSTKLEPGMEILTDSERVRKARLLNLELIFAEHELKCADCTFRFDCELLRLASEYKIKINRFKPRKSKRLVYKFSQAVEIDGSQCIDCRNCIETCAAVQEIAYLKMSGQGTAQEVEPVSDKKVACTYCGQCTLVCPVASAQEQYHGDLLEKSLQDESKVVVAQFAPAVRVSLGEEFGLLPGENCEGKIISALKELGCQHVFDINFGADITTYTEAQELAERLKEKESTLPIITSCCPAWVSYLEFYHPELILNLTTARSPQMHLAGAIKSYWADKKKIAKKNIVLVSIVPCTAKKHEASRQELFWQTKPLVDIVLTTRELAYLIKKHRIDFLNLKDSKVDSIFNEGTGAAAIYGASGGVMESALRTADYLLQSDKHEKIGKLKFSQVRGLKGLKEATVNLAGRKLKIGVVNGLGNVKKMIPKIKDYHYLEVMACPGGCLGGGGQPLPTTNEIRKKRLAGLYKIDEKRSLRRAHENKEMLKYYKFVKQNKLENRLLFTEFKKSTGSELNYAKPKVKS